MKRFDLNKFFKLLASLEVTLIGLFLLFLLVIACTLDQVNLGTFGAVDKYFRSFFLYAGVGGMDIPIFPAGGLTGILLLVNLAASMKTRFLFSKRKIGIWLIHLGLIVLIGGEFVTAIFAVESKMAIVEGESKNYSESYRKNELVVIEYQPQGAERVYSITEDTLRRGKVLSHPAWPFTLKLRSVFRNAVLGARPEGIPPSVADRGIGVTAVVQPREPASGDDERNLPAAFIDVLEGDRREGTWLVSLGLDRAQDFTIGRKRFALEMRPTRYYLPFSLMLKDFKHDVYPGTNIPKNFSSLVHLSHPEKGEERDVLIWMNNPFRYMGKTFYQSSFGRNDTLSILQVVENPGWVLPYISMVIMGVGLAVQFLLSVMSFKPVAWVEKGAER